MRRLLRLINEVSLAAIVLALSATVALFAAVYMGVISLGWGTLELTYASDKAIGYLDALYFSLVTISSLGYGDIRPVGAARLFAGAEVALGLAFFGLIVAKVSSVKQDYILRRLYYADLIDRKLTGYVTQLEEYRKLYRITSTMLLDGDMDPELTTTFCSDTGETTLFYQIHMLLEEIVELVKFEIHNGGFYGDVSDASVSKIYASVQGMLHHTSRLLERDSDKTCEHILCGNEERILEVLEVAHEFARIGRRHAKSAEIIEQCDSIQSEVLKLRPQLDGLMCQLP